ncbi:MAG: rRNA maturation RNase YbeY [Chloroflexi bacterium]|nr:rRNA maturation RNase YbeY [Chloroflexota bacterium]
MSEVAARVDAQIMAAFVDLVDLPRLERAAKLTLEHELQRGSFAVSLFVCDDATIAELNEQYLRHSGPTDVISFPLATPAAEIHFPDDPEGARQLGDVVISYERAVAQAAEYRLAPMSEVTLLFVHGLLHLLGYGDYTDEERQEMQRRAEVIVARVDAMGLSRGDSTP